MPRISYVNGRYVHHADAALHIEDRAGQFSDAVYEVIAFYNRVLLDEELHIRRLFRSLKELQIAPPMPQKAMQLVMRELIAQNDRTDGTIYLQVSRGVAKRDHVFPPNARPGLIMMVTGGKMPSATQVREGVAVITYPDIRWGRRDIKSVSLLANVLAKQEAAKCGVREAWLVDDRGIITEGAVSNSFIINAKDEIITHPADTNILGGVTRQVVMEMARSAGFTVMERPFSMAEAKTAHEAFLTSTTSNILAVVQIDKEKQGDGKPGRITRELLQLYYAHIFRQTGKILC